MKSLKNVVSESCRNCLTENVFHCIETNCMAPLGGPCQPRHDRLPLVTDHVRCETCAEESGCSMSVCTNPNSLRLHDGKGIDIIQFCDIGYSFAIMNISNIESTTQFHLQLWSCRVG